ncbi:MAG: TIGR01458 family HAD-type hydrolase [Calditrichaceae bacterium]
MSKIKGLLIDLDGVIYNENTPIPGSEEAIRVLSKSDIPFRFITNTTMKSRDTLRLKLSEMGIAVDKEKIFSAVYAATVYLRALNYPKCHLMLPDDAKKEFNDIPVDSGHVKYVVAGDLGKEFTYDKLNKAFLYLHNGARLIALQKNRFWLSDDGYKLDAGAFVALLEYAAGIDSVLIGKPAKPFFEMALKDIALPAENVLMIGDDIESDIAGAAALGITTCLVKTGKFRERDLDNSPVKPDMIFDTLYDFVKSLSLRK